MTASRAIGNAEGAEPRTMHMRGHAADIATNAEMYATQLEAIVDELDAVLFGPGPKPADAPPNVKPLSPRSLLDELNRADTAIGRIGMAVRHLANISERVQPSKLQAETSPRWASEPVAPSERYG